MDLRNVRTSTERILVIHQGALGDVILSFPALAALKEQTGGSVTLLCKDQIGKMAHKLNVVEAHLPIESAGFCELFSKDMKRDIISFINDYDTIVLFGFPGDVEDHIRHHHIGRTCKITPRPPAEEQTHVATHVIEQLQARGLLKNENRIGTQADLSNQPDLSRATWSVRKSESGTCDSLRSHQGIEPIPVHQGKGLMLVHPGAGSKRKRWPLENFVEVAAAIQQMRLGEASFLIGPAESDLFPLVKQRGARRFQIHRVENLAEVMAFMDAAKCFVGNDSGLTHLAAILGLSTVAVFGPSSPKRWSPIGGATKVVRGKADCEPCFETAETNCEDPQCLESVSVDTVCQAVQALTHTSGGYDDISGQG